MTDGNVSGSNGQGSGTGSQAANSQSPNSGGGGTSQGDNAGTNLQNGQGSTSEMDLSKNPAFTSLLEKVGKLEKDNFNYRQRIRSLLGDDGNEDGNEGSKSGKNDPAKEILQELRTERAYNRLFTAATNAGFVTPDVILNFVNLDEVADDKGNVAEPDKVVAGLKAKYPALFRDTVSGSGDGAAGSRNRSGNSGNDMNSIIRAKVRGG